MWWVCGGGKAGLRGVVGGAGLRGVGGVCQIMTNHHPAACRKAQSMTTLLLHPAEKLKYVGPVNLLRTKLVSGLKQELLVTVQAVRKNYPASGNYLIIHPFKWPTGRGGLGPWLEEMQDYMLQPHPEAEPDGAGRDMPVGLRTGSPMLVKSKLRSTGGGGHDPRLPSLTLSARMPSVSITPSGLPLIPLPLPIVSGERLRYCCTWLLLLCMCACVIALASASAHVS